MKNINIERNVTLNHENKTIEITKQFKKAACRFGSEEYKAIKEAVDAHPNYKVVTKTSARNKSALKLSYDYMTKYIKSHDDEEKTIWTEFLFMRGYTTEGEKTGISFSFADIQTWFLETYPEIESYIKDMEEKSNRLRQIREEKARAKAEAKLKAICA